jgi:bifunctional oligoribonuclease and PAP phosphatase NrnA
MIYTDPVAAAPAFAAQIGQAQRILLLTHINPDGDAIGSLLGAYHVLRALGKEPIPVAASALPYYSAALPGVEQVTIYQPGDALPDCDLIWMLDTAALDRVGQIYHDHGPAMRARPLIIVDHHVTNDGHGSLNLIEPHAASCADLLFRLLRAMEFPVSPEAATCMLLGLTTDTQSFQTSATSPQTLRTGAEILEAGADQRLVVNAVYFAVPFETVRLSGMATGELHREGGLLWTCVSQAMLNETGAKDEASDEATIRMQRVAGMRVAALFKERANGKVKISLRSVPGINVAEIARTWGGGGHAQAAGADLPMGLDEAEAAVLPLLRAALGM